MDTDLNCGNECLTPRYRHPLAWQGLRPEETMQSGGSEGALCDVMHHTVSEVIPEVKGVQAFPPVFFNNRTHEKKGKNYGT